MFFNRYRQWHKQRRNQSFRSSVVVLVAFILASFCSSSMGQNVKQHDLKAAFLYNFAGLITWPKSAFDNKTSVLKYCIVQDSKVSTSLEKLIKGEVVKGRPLSLAKIDNQNQLKTCQILFLSTSDPKKVEINLKLLCRSANSHRERSYRIHKNRRYESVCRENICEFTRLLISRI